MNSTLIQNAGTSVLGIPTGDLVFRVRGTGRDGHVLRLQGSKCTIGAADYCSLRLRAAGVRPFHCIVVRGAGSTLIRRWSSDTLLNGRVFDEAALLPGDVLSIGPIDLDVLETASVEGEARSVDLHPISDLREERRSLRSHSRKRVQRLVRRLREQSLEHEGLEIEWRDQVSNLEQKHDQDRETWNQQRQGWQADRDQWEHERASWKVDRERLNDSQADRQQAFEQESEQLAEQQLSVNRRMSELTKLEEDLAAERRTLKFEAETAREQLDASRLELNDERAQLEQLRETLEAERGEIDQARASRADTVDHDEADMRDRREDLERRETQIETREAKLNSKIELLAKQLETVETEQADLTSQHDLITRQREEMESRQAELTEQQARFVDDRAEFEAEQNEFEALRTDISQQQQALSEQQADLRTQSEFLVGQRDELARRELQVAEKASEFGERLANMESTDSLPHAKEGVQEGVSSHRATADSPATETPVTSLDEQDEPAMASSEDAGAEQGTLAASIIRQLQETDTAEALEAPAEDSPVESRIDVAPAVMSESSASVDTNSEDSEESINDYMRKLLERTRGVSQQAVADVGSTDDVQAESDNADDEEDASWKVAESKASHVSEDSPREDPAAVDETEWDAVSMAPRREAPEAHTDMDALRDLANQSAKSAIDTSLVNRWKTAAAGNACMSVMCFLAGYLVITNTHDETGNAYLGGAAALVGSVYWAVQCGLLMKNASWLYSGEKSGAYTTPVDALEDDKATDISNYETFELR